jgi:hypothetical protein
MSNPHRRLYLFSLLSWAVSRLLQKWLVVLIAIFFLSPVGPHLRWEYQYRGANEYRTYSNCTYLGSRGFFKPGYIGNCPLIAWLDSRGAR